jgi:hypothetical protein
MPCPRNSLQSDREHWRKDAAWHKARRELEGAYTSVTNVRTPSLSFFNL